MAAVLIARRSLVTQTSSGSEENLLLLCSASECLVRAKNAIPASSWSQEKDGGALAQLSYE